MTAPTDRRKGDGGFGDDWRPPMNLASKVTAIETRTGTSPWSGPRYSYQPVERVTQLIDRFGSGAEDDDIQSGNLEAFCRRVVDGMAVEYIYSLPFPQAIVEWNPELSAQALECENCTILLHDSLPDDSRCGLNTRDDCIGTCGHNPETAQWKP